LCLTGFFSSTFSAFSTFSAEVTSLLQQGRLAWAAAAISLHVGGSLAMTVLGMATVTICKNA